MILQPAAVGPLPLSQVQQRGGFLSALQPTTPPRGFPTQVTAAHPFAATQGPCALLPPAGRVYSRVSASAARTAVEVLPCPPDSSSPVPARGKNARSPSPGRSSSSAAAPIATCACASRPSAATTACCASAATRPSSWTSAAATAP